MYDNTFRLSVGNGWNFGHFGQKLLFHVRPLSIKAINILKVEQRNQEEYYKATKRKTGTSLAKMIFFITDTVQAFTYLNMCLCVWVLYENEVILW